MKEAFLIAWIDGHNGRVTEVGIYSEAHPTCNSNIVPAQLHRAVGPTFAEAARLCTLAYLSGIFVGLPKAFPLPHPAEAQRRAKVGVATVSPIRPRPR